MSTISVLVSTREETANGRTVRNRGDAVAVCLALGIAGADAVRLLSAGDMPESVARDYLALGARSIDLLPCGAADDPVPLLATSVADSALVLTGTRRDGGLASGVLPYALADALMRPMIPNVVAVTRTGDTWTVTQALPKGARRRLRLSVPAVLSIHPGAPVTLRHSYRDQLAGEVRRLPPAAAGTPSSDWTLVPAARRLERLQARRAQSGHGRMLGAIATEQTSSAATVLSEGSARDKALAVFDYLRQHSLLSL